MLDQQNIFRNFIVDKEGSLIISFDPFKTNTHHNYFGMVKISPDGNIAARSAWSYSELYTINSMYYCREGAILLAGNAVEEDNKRNLKLIKIEEDFTLCG